MYIYLCAIYKHNEHIDEDDVNANWKLVEGYMYSFVEVVGCANAS